MSPDALHFAALSKGGELRIYNAITDVPFRDRKPVKTLTCQCSEIAVSSGLKFAAAITNEGVKTFDLTNDQTDKIDIKDLGLGTFGKIALSPGGRYLALTIDEHGDVDIPVSRLRVINTKTKEIILAPKGLDMHVKDVSFGPAGDLAIAGRFKGLGDEGRIMLWPFYGREANSEAEPDPTHAFSEPRIIDQQREVRAVAPGPHDSFAADAGDLVAADGGVAKRVSGGTRYSVFARLPYGRHLPPSAAVKKEAFTHDAKTLVLARTIGAIEQSDKDFHRVVLEVWELPRHQDLAHMFHDREVNGIGFKPGGTLLVTMPAGDKPRVFRAVDGKQDDTFSFEADSGAGETIASADGAYTVDIHEGAVVVHDLWNKRKLPVQFAGGLTSDRVAAVSPGGQFLVLPVREKGDGRSISVLRAQGDGYHEWKRIAQPKEDLADPVAMSISIDGRRLAVLHGYSEGSVRIWNVDDGRDESPQELKNSRYTTQMALSPGGRFLAVTGRDEQTRLLDLSASGAPRSATLSEDGAIASMVFSTDERYLALGARDGAVHVFDTSVPQERIATLESIGRITAIALSDDNRYLAAAIDNSHPSSGINEDEAYPVRVWLLQPTDLIAEAEQRLAPFRSNPGLAASGP